MSLAVGGAARTAGKIVIPGGKFRARGGVGGAAAGDGQGDGDGDGDGAEWQHNGSGRLDVRGFRELRI